MWALQQTTGENGLMALAAVRSGALGSERFRILWRSPGRDGSGNGSGELRLNPPKSRIISSVLREYLNRESAAPIHDQSMFSCSGLPPNCRDFCTPEQQKAIIKEILSKQQPMVVGGLASSSWRWNGWSFRVAREHVAPGRWNAHGREQ